MVSLYALFFMTQERAHVKDLQSANTALKKNISCLFKTAKLELERKDSEIDKLKSESVRETIGHVN